MAKKLKNVGLTEAPNIDMILCHFTEGELEGFDNLQGGPSIDPNTGLREYSKLAPIIELPKIQDLFLKVSDDLKTKGKLSPQLHQVYEVAKKNSLSFKKAPQDNKPPASTIEKKGRGQDKFLALIPKNLALFLIKIHGGYSTNPKTGLLEFGYNGSTAVRQSNYSMNRPHQENRDRIAGFRQDNPGIEITPSIGSKIVDFAGILGNMMLRGSSSQLSNNSFTPRGNIGDFGQNLQPSRIPTIYEEKRTPKGWEKAWDVTKDILNSPMTSMIAQHLLAVQAEKKHHKDQNRLARNHNEEVEKTKREMGYYLPWNSNAKPDYQLVENPKYTPENTENYYNRVPIEYKKGGFVKRAELKSFSNSTGIYGPGNGQDDEIKTTIPSGSYIIDASTTADLGDGSSSSGIKVLEETAKQIRKMYPSKVVKDVEHMIKKQHDLTPVYVANEEFKFDPVTVSLAGHGNIKKGAEVFKKMVKQVRIHKASNGLGLPPKALHPMDYIKKSYKI